LIVKLPEFIFEFNLFDVTRFVKLYLTMWRI